MPLSVEGRQLREQSCEESCHERFGRKSWMERGNGKDLDYIMSERSIHCNGVTLLGGIFAYLHE
jgi:hypothetical protein